MFQRWSKLADNLKICRIRTNFDVLRPSYLSELSDVNGIKIDLIR